jgi:formyltetrahydrofolate hydrolase
MSENKILAAVAESLQKSSTAINQANSKMGVLAREFLYRSKLESELAGELIAMEAALKSVQESIRRQAQREALAAELDPQSRETFNALLAQNRARLSDLLKNEKSGR